MNVAEQAVPDVAHRLKRRIWRAQAQPTEALVGEYIRSKELLKAGFNEVAQAFKLEAIRVVFADRGVIYDA